MFQEFPKIVHLDGNGELEYKIVFNEAEEKAAEGYFMVGMKPAESNEDEPAKRRGRPPKAE